MDIHPWSPIVWLRTAYLSAASVILFVSVIPALRDRFLSYGARASDVQKSTGGSQSQSARKGKPSYIAQLLDFLASLNVPHSWFVSFYAVSVTCSLLWASVFMSKSFAPLSPAKAASTIQDSMSMDQIIVTWILMFVQGSRRLYECLAFSTTSESQMWIGHWAIGIVFYLATSIAVWIEGTSTLNVHELSMHDLKMTGPSLRTFVSAIIFILASGFQHDVHAYLVSLKDSGFSKGGRSVTNYQLPQHPAFNLCLTPHYFAECLIYLALTIQAAPRGSSVNWTMACALAFVIVNLGTTAHGTKAWYRKKFGVQAVQGRSRMIPFIY